MNHQTDILYNYNFKNGQDRWRGYTEIAGYKVGHLTSLERQSFEDAGFDFGGPPKFEGATCIKKRSTPRGYEWSYDPYEQIINSRLSQLQIGRNAASIAQLHNTVHPILNEDWKVRRAQGIGSNIWNTQLLDLFDERLVIRFGESDHGRAMNRGAQFRNLITVKTACKSLADSMTALLKPENNHTVFQRDGTDILRVGRPCTAGIISPFLRTTTNDYQQLSVYMLTTYVVVNECRNYDEIIYSDPQTHIWNYAEDVYVGLFMMSLGDNCHRRSANYGLFDEYVAEFGTGKWASTIIGESSYFLDIDECINDERCNNKLRNIHQSRGVKIYFAPYLNKQRRRMSINTLHNSPQFHSMAFSHVLPIGNCTKNQVRLLQYESETNLTAIWRAGRPSESPPLCQSCGLSHITRENECYHLLIFMVKLLRHIKLYLVQSPFQNAAEILTETNWKKFLEWINQEGKGESVWEQNQLLSKMAYYLEFSVPYLYTPGEYYPRYVNLKQSIKGFIFYKTTTIKRIENNKNGVDITYVNQTDHASNIITRPTKKRRIIDDNELLNLLATENVNNDAMEDEKEELSEDEDIDLMKPSKM